MLYGIVHRTAEPLLLSERRVKNKDKSRQKCAITFFKEMMVAKYNIMISNPLLADRKARKLFPKIYF